MMDEDALRIRLIGERRFDEAKLVQARRLEAHPEDPALHHQMAWLLAALKELGPALDHELTACRLAPDDPQYLLAASNYCAQLGDLETAQHYKVKADILNEHPRQTIQVQRVFTSIHDKNLWKGDVSPSGPGSSLRTTILIREQLEHLFRDLNIGVLCDAACGDAGWITQATDELNLYLGFDIVETLILQNLSRYAKTNHFFRVADITCDILPRADAILCRDCLVHFPLEAGMRTIENFKASGSTYLITTSFPTVGENVQTGFGGWRPLNLTAHPFDLPPPMMLLRERSPNPNDRHNDKSLGVWRLSELL